MNCKWILLVLLGLTLCVIAVSTGVAHAGKYKEASARNEADCNAWCAANKPDCEFCSTKSGCGKGFDKLKDWGGRGKNWHACGKRKTREEKTDENRAACDKWCKENPDKCDNCSAKSGCGSGFKKVKSFTGRGHNYYACKRTEYHEASDRNEGACKAWCDDNKPKCYMCSKSKCTGNKQQVLKEWTGRGKNWYACTQWKSSRTELERARKEECKKWCRDNPDKCDRCDHRSGCGSGYKKVKSFKGRGHNYYACRRTKYKEASKKNESACNAWCYANEECYLCSKSKCAGKKENVLKEWKGRGKNWYACKRHF